MSRPLKTVLAAALLFVSAPSNPTMAQNQTPATTKTETKSQGRVLGIGGIFFKATDQAKTREWYAKHLGLVDRGQGVMLPWREHDDPQKEHVTVWSTFPATTDYFAPGQATFMINYIVDGLDALLERLQEEGVKIDPKRMNEPYGRFAWIYDSDGNKIELWEPPKATVTP
jgi:catechol 2,3-dioxygenase-like lactoylglutathione lyase family enzyme